MKSWLSSTGYVSGEVKAALAAATAEIKRASFRDTESRSACP